jgi:hypothetical protein
MNYTEYEASREAIRQAEAAERQRRLNRHSDQREWNEMMDRQAAERDRAVMFGVVVGIALLVLLKRRK